MKCFRAHPGHSHRQDDLSTRAALLRATVPGSKEALAATIAEIVVKFPKSGGGDPTGE